MGSQPKVVLAIDVNRNNLALLKRFLEEQGFRVWAASTLEEIDRALLEPDRPDLALLDIAGFDRSIWDRCERLRDERIPFLVIYPHQRTTLQEESIEHGARGILVKPLAQQELLRLLQSLIGETRREEE